MPVREGTYQDRVTLQRIQGADDGTFSDLTAGANRWARIEWESGGARVFLRYDEEHGPISKRDAEPGMRVVHTRRGVTHVMDVTDVIEVDRMTEVVLVCEDVVVPANRLKTGGRRVKAWAG